MAMVADRKPPVSAPYLAQRRDGALSPTECFNDWGGRAYDDSVPGEVTKSTPFGDRTT